MALTDGATFAGYTIIRLLGSGGMGEVYLARHPRLPREDALKILNTAVTVDPDYRQRFEREADLVAGLWHPHIVGIHDRGEYDGQLWIAMDYVNGANAAELLQAAAGGLPPESVVAIIAAVAEALDYAHDRHLLHRDVKPANILIADEPSGQRILLADFGIARRDDDTDGLTATNMTVGTVAYCAPEQLMGRPMDGRADQYALAATAFHLLTGAPPFHDPNQAVVISRHLTAEPPQAGSHRPELAALDPALAKALSKDPADRFARCADFARALTHGISAPAAVDETRLSVAAPVDRPRRGLSRTAISVLVALVGLLIVAGAFAVGQFSGDREAASQHTEISRSPATTASTAPPAPVSTTSTPLTTVQHAGLHRQHCRGCHRILREPAVHRPLSLVDEPRRDPASRAHHLARQPPALRGRIPGPGLHAARPATVGCAACVRSFAGMRPDVTFRLVGATHGQLRYGRSW